MSARNLLVIASVIVALIFALLWYQGRKSTKQTIFDAAAKAAEDTAAVLKPQIAAEQERADSADARRERAEQRMIAAEARADSIAVARRIIIERIITDTVPEDSRRYTEPRDAVIASQQEEIGELRTALDEARVALIEADTAQRSLERALTLANRRAEVALAALAQRPSNRWYIPTLGFGYSATVSRREFMKEGRIEIHDGPSLSAVWSIGF